jgi:anti-sigma factor RsiW
MDRAPHEAALMTCQEAIGLLADYLDMTLGPEALAQLERHLEGCDPCQAYLATYRRTKSLAAESSRVEMPLEMRRRLGDFLIDQSGRERS